MGSRKSGNLQGKGKQGNKGGTGRPPKPPEELKTKAVRMSQRLFVKINIAATQAGFSDWREFLESEIEGLQ